MGFFYGLLPPPAKIVGNVSSYYSGHYCTYGIDLQAIAVLIVGLIFLC
jgi:hypothetical protein